MKHTFLDHYRGGKWTTTEENFSFSHLHGKQQSGVEWAYWFTNWNPVQRWLISFLSLKMRVSYTCLAWAHSNLYHIPLLAARENNQKKVYTEFVAAEIFGFSVTIRNGTGRRWSQEIKRRSGFWYLWDWSLTLLKRTIGLSVDKEQLSTGYCQTGYHDCLGNLVWKNLFFCK